MDEKLTPYEQEFVNVLDEIKNLFLTKTRSYNDTAPFANFAMGGILLYGDNSFSGCFDTLKAYAAKHIANVYGHKIAMPGLDESMRDIATYMVIATVMKRQFDRALAQEAAAAVEPENAQAPVMEEPAIEPEIVEDAD